MDLDGYTERLDQLVSDGRLSSHTAQSYRRAVERFDQWWDGDGLPDREDVSAYLNHLADGGAARGTIEPVFAGINRYMRWEGESGRLNGLRDDLRDIFEDGDSQETPPDYLTDEQIAELKRVAADSAPRDNAIVTLFVATGCRPGELVALDLDDIDLKEGEVIIERTDRNERVRDTYPLDGDEVAALEAYLDDRPPVESDALLVTDRGRVSTDTVRRRLTRLAGKAPNIDPDEIHPSMIRHWVGVTLARDEGKTTREIADYLGHTNTATAEKYTRLATND